MARTETDAERWQRHVARWRAGQQTVPAYCHEHGLAVAAMRYQIRRQSTAAPMRVARVERVAEPTRPACVGAIVIEVGRARVRVEAGADAATLATVLAALEGTR